MRFGLLEQSDALGNNVPIIAIALNKPPPCFHDLSRRRLFTGILLLKILEGPQPCWWSNLRSFSEPESFRLRLGWGELGDCSGSSILSPQYRLCGLGPLLLPRCESCRRQWASRSIVEVENETEDENRIARDLYAPDNTVAITVVLDEPL